MTTMVLQFLFREGVRPCSTLCFNFHTTVENFNRNVSIGQLLQQISKYILVCGRSRPKIQTETC